MLGRVIRTAVITAIIFLFLALIIFNANTKPSLESKVWDMRTTIGSTEAENHYIMYTDLMCPYCDVFSRIIHSNLDEFKRDYIEGKNILFEMRITDFLYEFGAHKTEYSRQSAEAIYCATAEDKFWDYY